MKILKITVAAVVFAAMTVLSSCTKDDVKPVKTGVSQTKIMDGTGTDQPPPPPPPPH